jgi:hypothetical protein
MTVVDMDNPIHKKAIELGRKMERKAIRDKLGLGD